MARCKVEAAIKKERRGPEAGSFDGLESRMMMMSRCKICQEKGKRNSHSKKKLIL